MNRRQNVQQMGFQMPTGLRTVQRSPNSFLTRPINNYNGANASVAPISRQQSTQQPPSPSSKGGFLSKLIGGKKTPQTQPIQDIPQQGLRGGFPSQLPSFGGFSGAPVGGTGGAPNVASGVDPSDVASAGGLAGLAGAFSLNNIQKWVGNTQQMINTAQQALPMVQQYGPLVRNFPSMWKLYRSLKSEPTNSETSKDKPLLNTQVSDVKENQQSDLPEPTLEKTSTPRLYV